MPAVKALGQGTPRVTWGPQAMCVEYTVGQATAERKAFTVEVPGDPVGGRLENRKQAR